MYLFILNVYCLEQVNAVFSDYNIYVNIFFLKGCIFDDLPGAPLNHNTALITIYRE